MKKKDISGKGYEIGIAEENLHKIGMIIRYRWIKKNYSSKCSYLGLGKENKVFAQI